MFLQAFPFPSAAEPNLFRAQAAQGAAGAGPDMNAGAGQQTAGGADDDVVDADYKEV